MGNSNSTKQRPPVQTKWDNPPPAYKDGDPYVQSPTQDLQSPIKDPKSPVEDSQSPTKTDYADSGASADAKPKPTPGSSRFSRRFSRLGSNIRRQSSISEDTLELLRKYDVWILVDDSASMGEYDKRRWLEARDALAPLAEKAGRYDTDGLDLFFLNDQKKGEGLTNAAGVLQIFEEVSPTRGTPLGYRLEELLQPYLEKLEAAGTDFRKIKPLDVVVITDGMPTDDPESVIVAIARRLDQGKFPLSQLGIQFVQVGNDSGASRFLKSLDDSLTSKYNIRDIVDTLPASKLRGGLNADALGKALLGGINRLVDKSDV